MKATAVQLANTGEIDIGEYDVMDLGLSATRLNFVGQTVTGALIDVNLNASLVNKRVENISIDLKVGVLNPGFGNIGRSINPLIRANDIVINGLGLIVRTGSGMVGTKGAKND